MTVKPLKFWISYQSKNPKKLNQKKNENGRTSLQNNMNNGHNHQYN